MSFTGQDLHTCPECGVRVRRLVRDQKEAVGYALHEEIGRGGFGVVHRAHAIYYSGQDGVTTRLPPLGTALAVKLVEKRLLMQSGKESRILEEVSLQDRASTNPHVVKLYSAFEDVSAKAYCLITELCERGDLAKALERRDHPFPESEVRCVARSVADALAFLHRNRVIHRDVKLANILIASDGVYKLADFGLATMDEPPSGSGRIMGNIHQTMCGTPSALAPEVASGQPYGAAVDLWGLGIALYTLLVGRAPFENGQGGADAHRVTLENIRTLSPSIPTSLSMEATHLLNGLLQKVRTSVMVQGC